MNFRVFIFALLAFCGFLLAEVPAGVSFVEDPELGAPFQVHHYQAGKAGEFSATLVHLPWSHAGKPKASILYIHGFNDYFFQKELAQVLDSAGYSFYAIDLHNYGRSYHEGEVLGELRTLTSYFPELDSAVQKIRSLENGPVVMLGHSTGGLISVVYANRRGKGKNLDAIVLNSPFLDMNMTPLVEAIVPAASLVGVAFPNIKVTRSKNTSYSESLHKDYRGEWDFSLKWKVFESLPVDLGWTSAIHAGHVAVQRGMDLQLPILVMHSGCSVPAGVKEWREDYTHCDGVLDVEDIDRYGRGLGKNVKMETIEGGLHDLYLSKKPVREKAYDVTIQFLDALFTSAGEPR